MLGTMARAAYLVAVGAMIVAWALSPGKVVTEQNRDEIIVRWTI